MIERIHNTKALTAGLFVAVLAFGAFIAVGAALFNHDLRKALVVAGCTLAFLALWLSTVRRASGRAPTEQSATSSVTGFGSIDLLACISVVTAWGLALWGRFYSPTSAGVALSLVGAAGLLSLLGFVASLVRISDPVSTPGKKLALLSLLLTLALWGWAIGQLLVPRIGSVALAARRAIPEHASITVTQKITGFMARRAKCCAGYRHPDLLEHGPFSSPNSSLFLESPGFVRVQPVGSFRGGMLNRRSRVGCERMVHSVPGRCRGVPGTQLLWQAGLPGSP